MAQALGGVGVIGYVLVGVVYFGSALVMPRGVAYLFWSGWAAGWFGLYRVYRRSPAWTLAVPLVALAFWVMLVQLGSWAFGWTA